MLTKSVKFSCFLRRETGLDVGADDCLVKPFSIPELFARIRVSRAKTEIHLGPTEFKLLEHIMRRPSRGFSREQLLDAVWGLDISVETRTVDLHIGRLRKALKIADHKDTIRTVRSAGYALRPEG